ncbi:bacteriophytochrome (light-regulated signal transduction histidine kinase) [Xenococcus sp. PCC 7305]|uniref:sensor histidine kinase n=1 Tax=Xenococcus sp. PCC 7305 TaxID=102125 RepID=UPI0002ACC598|nr:ATP-binding protein [Xenococcus sp. PCC 7305]ELS03556.1 bacteriophytochrome (light-regulated signal transduction histidine kinase) [Xenococcus sp. PCC 7305]
MNTINTALDNADLLAFERKPIHNSGKIQPYGVVLVLQEPDLKILQVSTNSYAVFGISPEEMLEKSLEDILDPFQIEKLEMGLQQDNLDFINPTKIWARKHGDDYVIFDGVFHRNTEGNLILELEPATSQENIPFLSFYHLARASINQLQETSRLRDFCQIIVQEVRKVTGFDRVMLYKFDEDNHGAVIAEEKLDHLESYLDLHYPASDIPKQARKLFSSNWIRIIPDTKAEPVALYPLNNPISDRPLDLTNSILRSPSACHLEYLHNMGVGASLTISLIEDGKLWGLIACHHLTPKYVSYELRKACEFLGRVIFSEISNREETEDYDYRMKLNYFGSQLVDDMSQSDDFVSGLIKHDTNLLNLTSARGAAVCYNGNWTLLGETPAEEELNFLVKWLYQNIDEEVFTTDSLAKIYPDADQYKNTASGLVAMAISRRNYVLWFRPEVIQTVNWGGDPHNAYQADHSQGNLKMSPRKSFELWKETVRLTSLPWKQVEVNAVKELRKAIVNIVLRKADELALLTNDLQRSNAELKRFAYVASHDLQEPLNHVSNYVQLLEMRYGERLDEDAKDFIGFAVEGVTLMQTLIDDVLAYSKVDSQVSQFELTEVRTPLEQALTNLQRRISESQAVITIQDNLPTIMADQTQLMQLFQNLLSNAIKFRSSAVPEIEIKAERQEYEWLFSVKDNAIGIDPQFCERIFIIFQRLHTRDEYPGTGMGLAICKKIIECHRGRIWVESELGKGSTFYFTIPVGGRERDRRN